MMLMNGVIALYDFSFYRIPNILVFAIIVLYFCTVPFLVDLNELIFSVGIFAGVLAVGFALFFFGIFGGGDAKYLAACAMWAGPEHILPFLLIVSFSGGVLALSYLLGQSKIAIYSTNLWNQILLLEKRYTQLQYVWTLSGKGPENHKRQAIKRNQIPYGVAISLGMIAVLYLKLIT